MLPLCGIPSIQTRHLTIETEWFDKYPNVKNHYKRYIERADFLRINAPLYFQKLTETFQNQLGQMSLKDFEKLDLSLLKLTCKCFPEQFTDLDLDERYTRICIYPLTIRAYILGFPCYPAFPEKKEVDDALLHLSKIGIKEYIELVLEKDKYSKELIANEHDTLYENPDDYHPMDRINILENGKMYRFTRPEFKKLKEDLDNFWTKTPLSYSNIYTLTLRIHMIEQLNFPPADTLAVMLEKACDGVLYQVPVLKSESDIIQNPTTSLENIFQQIIQGQLLNLNALQQINPSLSTEQEPSEEDESIYDS